jgi:predicted nucleotidyltransferase
MQNSEFISVVRNRLQQIDPKAKAILYGSRARGSARKDSDWDILILLDKPRISLDDYDKYSYPIADLGWDNNEIFNPVLFTMKEWKDNKFTLFNHNVMKDAIQIC